MKVIWDDGYSREATLMGNLCGFKRRGHRPSSVSFTQEELVELFYGMKEERFRKWFTHILLTALKTYNKELTRTAP